MSWTYSGSPSDSPLDEVRFLIGDTNTSDQRLSNEEINYLIAYVYGDTPPPRGNLLPAALAAESIAAAYSSVVSKSVGDLSISYGERSKKYADLAASLRRRADLLGVRVYAGGLSLGEKQALNSQPDRADVAIKIDGMTQVSSLDEPIGEG